jgi:hypothetical protein
MNAFLFLCAHREPSMSYPAFEMKPKPTQIATLHPDGQSQSVMTGPSELLETLPDEVHGSWHVEKTRLT